MRQKNHVRPSVCPEKQRVLSRSFSTDHISSIRGKYSTSDSARFWKNQPLRRWEVFFKVPKKSTFLSKMSANCRWKLQKERFLSKMSAKCRWFHMEDRPGYSRIWWVLWHFSMWRGWRQRLAQTCFCLIHAKAPKGVTLPCGFNLVKDF